MSSCCLFSFTFHSILSNSAVFLILYLLASTFPLPFPTLPHSCYVPSTLLSFSFTIDTFQKFPVLSYLLSALFKSPFRIMPVLPTYNCLISVFFRLSSSFHVRFRCSCWRILSLALCVSEVSVCQHGLCNLLLLCCQHSWTVTVKQNLKRQLTLEVMRHVLCSACQ